MRVKLQWGMQRRKFLTSARNVSLVAGFSALGICAFVYLDALIFQRSQARLDQKISARIPSGVDPAARKTLPPLRLSVTDGTPVGRIEIPRLGVSVVIVEGIKPHDLRLAVGHIPETAFPDEPGNVGLAGHRDTFFRPLRKIRSGDLITVTTAHGIVRYSTEWTRIVKPDDVSVLKSSGDPALTLVTCYPFYFVGGAPERFVVRANPVAQDGFGSRALTSGLFRPQPRQ